MDRRKSEHAGALASASLAGAALAWIAETDDLLRIFLSSTGLDPDDLRRRSDDPELLAAVLDFVMMDDHWVMGCAAAAGVAPERLVAARAQLPGGMDHHWT
ncbi:MAG: DUF3572 domain-containing protein [Qingshengfaniella sp.]